MIDRFIAGLVALMAAALLYIGAHDMAGMPDVIIADDALALAGLLAVALGGKLLHDDQRQQK